MVTRRPINDDTIPAMPRPTLSMPATDARIIAVVPANNQAREIGMLISKLRSHADEVVVVDDGSNDDTARIAEAAGACVLKHAAELGPEEALQTGFRAARALGADLIIMPANVGDFTSSNEGLSVAAEEISTGEISRA